MRRSDGRETWYRLLEWDKGQAAAERLASVILINEGFRGVDPSHPLGGRDGLKDMVLVDGGNKWIGAVFFPRGQQKFSEIKSKFIHDMEGVKQNDANGLVFLTNQELRLSERKELVELDSEIDVQLYHLERISTLLNSPTYYGIRMEFLEIEMSKEEQVSFFAKQNQKISTIEDMLEKLTKGLVERDNCQETMVSNTECVEEYEEDFENYEEQPRTLEEIIDAIDQFIDKIWFDRHLSLRYRIENGKETVNPEIWERALKSAQRVIDKYGENNLGPYSDFEWGMLNGKLSALRWVLGDEWDMLDT